MNKKIKEIIKDAREDLAFYQKTGDHSHEHIPTLIAEIERLEEENVDMLIATQNTIRSLEDIVKENTKLQRVCEQLKSCIELRATQYSLKIGYGANQWKAFLSEDERQALKETEK